MTEPVEEEHGGLQHLGGDVWLSPARAPSCLMIKGRPHYRFMDYLLIPAPTPELDVTSILAINRWRERLLISSDLPHRALVRSLVIEALQAVPHSPIIEIGCGKFPLQADFKMGEYAGLDIDFEAIAYCRERGICMADDPGELTQLASRARVIVALFSFQFGLSSATEGLLRQSAPECLIMANVPTKDTELVNKRSDLLRSFGMEVRSIEFEDAHDRLLIAGRPPAEEECSIVAAVAQQRLVDHRSRNFSRD